jgi:hypothetical protein
MRPFLLIIPGGDMQEEASADRSDPVDPFAATDGEVNLTQSFWAEIR